MTPEAIALALTVLEFAIKEEPVIAKEIRDLMTKADATPADWLALRQRVLAKSYKDLVPNSQIQNPS